MHAKAINEEKVASLTKEETVAILGNTIQEMLADKISSKKEGLPICDFCSRFGRALKSNDYCYHEKHGSLPHRGYCSGLQPPEGVTVDENGHVCFSRKFLVSMKFIKEA